MSNSLVSVEGLKKFFPVRKGILGKPSQWLRAVDDVAFRIDVGRTLGLVGESGCGKSTTGRTLLRLIEPDAGQILFEGRDILRLGGTAMQSLRKDMQLVFQDPYASLNPRLSVRQIIEENLVVHKIGTRSEQLNRIEWVLKRVGIRPEYMDRYPHEFSGGQRQRIGIARALVLRPKLVVADEPVSALDVSIQAQVMNLLVEIQEELQLSYLLIAHDLAVVEHMSDDVAVMYLGRIIEVASDIDIYRNPRHPYTQLLLKSVPGLCRRQEKRQILTGEVPSPLNPPSGCHFHSRCPRRMDVCSRTNPRLVPVSRDHRVACHLWT